MGDKLIVALNSDEWLINKKQKYFMPFNERKTIIENLLMVDKVIDFDDGNKQKFAFSSRKIKKSYPDDQIIFCNGGDRNKSNIPEMDVKGIDFVFGSVEKIKNSSSWI